MKNDNEVIVPMFPGFYHSELDAIIDITMESEIDYHRDNDPDFNLDEYEQNFNYPKVCEYISKAWLERFNQVFSLNLKWVDIDSPREYNFTTDRLVAEITEEEFNRIREQVDKKENEGIFQKVIDRHFKSRDGFCSFYSTDMEEYKEKPFEDLDLNERMVYLETYLYISQDLDDEYELRDLISDEISYHHTVQEAYYL